MFSVRKVYYKFQIIFFSNENVRLSKLGNVIVSRVTISVTWNQIYYHPTYFSPVSSGNASALQRSQHHKAN